MKKSNSENHLIINTLYAINSTDHHNYFFRTLNNNYACYLRKIDLYPNLTQSLTASQAPYLNSIRNLLR